MIPVSAHHDVNLDILIQAIEEIIPTPDRSGEENGLMYVARSFDINRPGTRPEKLTGGILGGSIVEGYFSVGDKILIAPGRRIQKGNKFHWEPLPTVIESIKGGGNDLESAHAGGLCGIGNTSRPCCIQGGRIIGSGYGESGGITVQLGRN